MVQAKTSTALGLIVGSYVAFLFFRHPILLKLISSSETRIAGFPEACTVQINEQKLRGAKCFRLVSGFNWDQKRWNRPIDNILLWLPNRAEYRGHNILVADLEYGKAGRLGSANTLSVDLIWNQILVQSQEASGYVPFTNGLKFCGQDPNFQQKEQQIRFTAPQGCVADWLGGKTLEITLNP